MGTNNLTLVGLTTPKLAIGSMFDQFHTAISVDFVPRNSGGTVTASGGDLGTSLYPWKDLVLSNDITVNTDAFFVDGSAKNISIGTATQNYRQTIYKASDPIIQLINSASGTTATDGFLVHLAGSEARLNNLESGAMTFYTSGTEKVRIDSSGNVGVGDSTPTDAKLKIIGIVDFFLIPSKIINY